MSKRTDLNQKEIVDTFRKLGATVQIISDIGKGCPDLIIGMCKKNFLIEVKNGNLHRCQQKLTEHEQKFFDSWRGQVDVISSIDEAIDFYRSHVN